MTTPREIEKLAWDFYDKVIEGLQRRPGGFPTDKAMAEAAGLTYSTFCDYKNRKTGTEEPNFIYIYKLAYILKGSPPCSIESPKDITLFKIKEVRKKDNYGILDKILSIIGSEMDLEPLVAIIDNYYKRLNNSPREAGENL